MNDILDIVCKGIVIGSAFGTVVRTAVCTAVVSPAGVVTSAAVQS